MIVYMLKEGTVAPGLDYLGAYVVCSHKLKGLRCNSGVQLSCTTALHLNPLYQLEEASRSVYHIPIPQFVRFILWVFQCLLSVPSQSGVLDVCVCRGEWGQIVYKTM